MNAEKTPLLTTWQKWSMGAILLAMVGITAWAWLQIPDGQQIPVHWGIDGRPDGYGSKSMALFIAPMVGLVLVLLIGVFARMEPHQQNVRESRMPLAILQIGLLLFFLLVHVLIVLAALGSTVDVARWLVFGMGLLFCVIGNFMGKIRQNFFMGVRTPWTLSSEHVWQQTHRVSGWVFAVLGALLALGALFGLPAPILFGTLMIGIVVVVVTSFGYSYWLWRAEQSKKA